MKSALFILLFAGTALAQPRFTFRVTGLFAPEREAEFLGAVKDIANVTLIKIDFENALATFEIDVAKAFPGTKADKVLERLDQAVRQTNGTFGVKAPTTTPREKLTRVEIGVGGLDCKACAFAAYDAIARIEGVEQATVDFKTERVSALIDPAKTDRAAIEAALKKCGVEIK
jgi:copper chaperone CopZ